MAGGTNLFDPVIVAQEHHAFRDVRLSPFHENVRRLINDTFSKMGDPDGNFVQGFQSGGFHSRLFELACFAYLAEQELSIDRSHTSPDFMVRRDSLAFAIEAVTSNPSHDQAADISLRRLRDVPFEEILEKCGDEFPIRMGGPLSAKVQKQYWKLPHCRDLPLVLIIGPFHEAGSQTYVDESLARYLYGVDRLSDWTQHNGLFVREARVPAHSFGAKVIPSDFFGSPDADHISAVVYCNQFSVSKFLRMAAQQHGLAGLKKVTVQGTHLAEDWAAEPFSYEMGSVDAPVETWSSGVTIFHNPKARLPLPLDALSSSSSFHYRDGRLSRELSGFHSLVCMTHSVVPRG